MNSSNKDLDFLQEIAKKISNRSKQGSPIMPDEVFDLFKETLESMTEVRTIEVPIFMPFLIEKESDYFVARCHAFRVCRGIGDSEEEAIQKLKEQIELYNRTSIESEKRTRIEEKINNIFPKDCF